VKDETKANGNGRARRLDNYKLFRREAVDAYTTRRAGDPWETRMHFEGGIIFALTLVAALAFALLFLGGH
jgi:hypothetical protein